MKCVNIWNEKNSGVELQMYVTFKNRPKLSFVFVRAPNEHSGHMKFTIDGTQRTLKNAEPSEKSSVCAGGCVLADHCYPPKVR